jgi:hypothetical protein
VIVSVAPDFSDSLKTYGRGIIMKTIKFLLTIFFSLAVVACGGGSGYGSGNGGGSMCGIYNPIYSISGTVSPGSHIGGVSIGLTGGTPSTTTDINGKYSFTCLANGTYTVTPSLVGYTFSPASAVVAVSGVNMTQDFTESP